MRCESGQTYFFCYFLQSQSELRDNGICWPKKELSLVHGTLHIFLRIKLFCLLRQNAEIFSISLIQDFVNLCKNFSLFRQTFRQLFSMGNKSCPNFTKSKTRQMLKFSAFYPEKQKSLNPPKNEVYHFSRIVLSSTNRCPLDLITFPNTRP